MVTVEEIQHTVLLIVIAALFILFSTAIVVPLRFPITPIIFP